MAGVARLSVVPLKFAARRFSPKSAKLNLMKENLEQFDNSAAFAARLDAADALRDFREKFYIPKQSNGADTLYFTGNSLGLQPKTARAHIEQEGTLSERRRRNPSNTGNAIATNAQVDGSGTDDNGAVG